MKLLLKKVNRGVILSLAIILAIVLYYLYIALLTAPAAKALKATTQSISAICAEAVAVPDTYKKDGITETEMQPYFDTIIDKLEPYFTSRDIAKIFFERELRQNLYYQTVEPNQSYTNVAVQSFKCRNAARNADKSVSADCAIRLSADYTAYTITVGENGKVTRGDATYRNSGDIVYLSGRLTVKHVGDKWLISACANMQNAL